MYYYGRGGLVFYVKITLIGAAIFIILIFDVIGRLADVIEQCRPRHQGSLS